MFRVFLTRWYMETPTYVRNPVIAAMDSITDPGAWQIHYYPKGLWHSSVLTVAYSDNYDLDGLAVVPGIDRLPPQRSDLPLPQLPQQARADFNAIFSDHGLPSNLISGGLLDTVDNIMSYLDPDQTGLGSLRNSDPGAWA